MPKATKKSTKVTTKKTKAVEYKMEAPVKTIPAAPTSTPYPVALVAVLIILALLVYAYYRFWNIASVNGKPVSRIKYYQTMEKQIGKDTLENLITETLIIDTAEKKGVTVEQSVIDQEVADIKTRIEGQGQTLDAALIQEGMTLADLERQLRIQKFVETLSATSSAVTEQQINEFLTSNKDQLPQDATQEELRELAITQLDNQAKSTNVQNWLAEIRAAANIIYR